MMKRETSEEINLPLALREDQRYTQADKETMPGKKHSIEHSRLLR